MPIIDSQTYDKHAIHPPGYGYEARGAVPSRVVVHSTSNPHQRNTAFSAEATFLLHDADASADYLIGKDGAIVQFLDSRHWAAWHAGRCLPAWQNQNSIGIELHHSVGDPPYPPAQLGALSWLLQSLMAQFAISVDHIETHGQIALAGPYQRKTDPSDWNHAAFLIWRNTLVRPSPLVRSAKAGACGAIAQTDRRPDAPTAGLWYPPGSWIMYDDLTNGYIHAADGIGFVPIGQVVL